MAICHKIDRALMIIKYNKRKKKLNKKKHIQKSKSFIIFANPRSGSTWLSETLNLHPQIACFDEPFNHARKKESFFNLLQTAGSYGVFKKIRYMLSDKKKRIYGCKHLVSHLNDENNLLLVSDVDFIIFLRRITTESVVSFYRSLSMGIWHIYDENDQLINMNWPEQIPHLQDKQNTFWSSNQEKINNFYGKRMSLSIKKIRQALIARKKRLVYLRSEIEKKHKTVIDLSYNDLFTNPKKHVENIYQTMGIPYHNKFSSEIKMNNNYDWLINKDAINKAVGAKFGYLT